MEGYILAKRRAKGLRGCENEREGGGREGVGGEREGEGEREREGWGGERERESGGGSPGCRADGLGVYAGRWSRPAGPSVG